MEYIRKFTEEELCKFILETKESLFICLPLLQPGVMQAIDELDFNLSGNIAIHIGQDFSPETFRQGYGEIDAYDDIWKTDYDVRNMEDNRISFVISDSAGYFLFFESRYFIPAEKATRNAVMIDPISMVRLKHQFFNAFEESALQDQLTNAIIEESIQLNNIKGELPNSPIIISSKIDYEDIKSVKENLEKNPPLRPDYKRIVEFYSNKFQYVVLKYIGANLKSRKIELPPNALPIKDSDLKKNLESKLNLFDQKRSQTCFKLMDDFKDKVKKIRKEYLTPLKCRDESVLKRSLKSSFQQEVQKLEKEIESLMQNSILSISKQISETQISLQNDLKDFYMQYPELISKQMNLFKNNNEYVEIEATNHAIDVINKIHWPAAYELFSGLCLTTNFSDITFEDLQNGKLLNEFHERKLIDDLEKESLADFGKGINVE